MFWFSTLVPKSSLKIYIFPVQKEICLLYCPAPPSSPLGKSDRIVKIVYRLEEKINLYFSFHVKIRFSYYLVSGNERHFQSPIKDTHINSTNLSIKKVSKKFLNFLWTRTCLKLDSLEYPCRFVRGVSHRTIETLKYDDDLQMALI